MLKLLPYLKGYRVKTILGPLFKLVEAILELLVPVVVAKIIDEAIPAGRAGDYSLLTKYGVYMLVLAAVGLLFALVAQYFASRASMGFGTNLRKGLYEHINTLSQADIDSAVAYDPPCGRHHSVSARRCDVYPTGHARAFRRNRLDNNGDYHCAKAFSYIHRRVSSHCDYLILYNVALFPRLRRRERAFRRRFAFGPRKP